MTLHVLLTGYLVRLWYSLCNIIYIISVICLWLNVFLRVFQIHSPWGLSIVTAAFNTKNLIPSYNLGSIDQHFPILFSPIFSTIPSIKHFTSYFSEPTEIDIYNQSLFFSFFTGFVYLGSNSFLSLLWRERISTFLKLDSILLCKYTAFSLYIPQLLDCCYFYLLVIVNAVCRYLLDILISFPLTWIQ